MDLVNRLAAPRVYRLARSDTASAGSTRAGETDIVCDVMGHPASPSTTESRTVRLLTVADLHQRKNLYSELQQAIAEHKPDAVALLGDYLHGFDLETDMMPVEACASAISALKVPQVVAVRGNHEGLQFLEFADAVSSTDRTLTTLHGEAAQVGRLTVVGFPCLLGDETAFSYTKPALPSTPGAWLPPLLRRIGPAARAIWFMHEPPARTKLSERSGPLAGNAEWTELIERFAPRLVICGHDHETPMRAGTWHDRIGDTAVVNVGQSVGEHLHYAVIDATLVNGVTALPREITVRAHPWQEQLVWGADGWTLQAVSVRESDRNTEGRVAGVG